MLKIYKILLVFNMFHLAAGAQTYTTEFSNNENPVSEGDRWITVGRDGND